MLFRLGGGCLCGVCCVSASVYSGPYSLSLALVCVLGGYGVLGALSVCVSFELTIFLSDLIDVCTAINHVDCLTNCVMDYGGPVTFALRSGVGVQLKSCLTGYGVPLVDRG